MRRPHWNRPGQLLINGNRKYSEASTAVYESPPPLYEQLDIQFAMHLSCSSASPCNEELPCPSNWAWKDSVEQRYFQLWQKSLKRKENDPCHKP